MLYDLSAVAPFAVVLAVVAFVGSVASLSVLGQSVARHHGLRVARHQSIPTYYRRLVLAH
jgi:hypothetical protein